MRLWWCLSFVAVSSLAVFCVGESAATETLPWRFNLSLGYHYSSGTYGTSDTTEIAYVPLRAKAEIGRWSLQGTVPYLRISGPGGFVQGPSGPVQSKSGEFDGLGDILACGSYILPEATVWMPSVEVFGLVKFPTADRDKGLGTGKFDFGLETEFAWAIRKFTPFAAVGYRFLGSPPGTQLHDVFQGSVGGLYGVLDALDAGALLDYRQAPSSSVGERLEIVPFASWKVDRHWSVDVYTSAGLATGSPDVGVGLQIGYTLPSISSVTSRQ